MYIRISRGDRRLEQMGQKNLAVLVIAKKVANTSRETTFCALLVLVSEPIVFHIGRLALELRVTLHNRRNFSRVSLGRTNA